MDAFAGCAEPFAYARNYPSKLDSHVRAKIWSIQLLAIALFPATSWASVPNLERSLQAYSANPADEKAYNSAMQSAQQIIASNSSNAACSVYAFGILQIVEGMPVYVSASNKSIIALRASKDESLAQVGPETAARWDELINQAQAEFQKGLIYRGDVIGRYFSKIKSYCK